MMNVMAIMFPQTNSSVTPTSFSLLIQYQLKSNRYSPLHLNIYTVCWSLWHVIIMQCVIMSECHTATHARVDYNWFDILILLCCDVAGYPNHHQSSFLANIWVDHKTTAAIVKLTRDDCPCPAPPQSAWCPLVLSWSCPSFCLLPL